MWSLHNRFLWFISLIWVQYFPFFLGYAPQKISGMGVLRPLQDLFCLYGYYFRHNIFKGEMSEGLLFWDKIYPNFVYVFQVGLLPIMTLQSRIYQICKGLKVFERISFPTFQLFLHNLLNQFFYQKGLWNIPPKWLIFWGINIGAIRPELENTGQNPQSILPILYNDL